MFSFIIIIIIIIIIIVICIINKGSRRSAPNEEDALKLMNQTRCDQLLSLLAESNFATSCTPNLPTNIVDFRGCDSSTILI